MRDFPTESTCLPPRTVGWAAPLVRQMAHAWVITLLLGSALCGVVALHTYVRNSARFQNRSMQLIMKDTGHNLWFLNASANLLDVVTASPDVPGFADDRIHRLSSDRQIASTYWGNVLQGRMAVRDREVLLTGLEVVEDHQVTEEKSHLLDPLPPETAALGYTLARDWSLAPGDVLEVGQRRYRIQTVHPANGTLDDSRLWVPLADAQDWLEKPGQTNLILGFLCMRGLPLDVGLERLEQRLAEAHADVQVIPLMNLLNARELARITTSRYLDYLLIVVMAVTALLIAAVGWMEVNQRRCELAILMSMGASHVFILLFFLAKLCLLAVAATLTGFVLGSFFSVHWLSPVLVAHTQPVAVVWSDLPRILMLVLALVAVAAIAPLMYLARLDPTRILVEE